MKIVVTSDIHRNIEALIKIEKENMDATYYLDCGDSCLNEFQLGSFITVKGNCDFEDYPLYRVIKVNDSIKIFMTHSHKYSKQTMISLAKLNDCNIILYGHTHIPLLETIDDITIINPGSVSRPRGGSDKSYLIIEESDNFKTPTFKFIKFNND